jgi:hypothetical protein
MASAAFPIGLPPLHLTQGKELPLHWGEGTDLSGHRIIALTDGGVLENLGIQTLLKSRADFRAWDIIASDAGLKEHPWKPDRLGERLMGFMMGVIAAPIMKRITGLMNDKENRHMRHQTFLEMEKTWLADGVRKQEIRDAEGMKEFIRPMPDRRRRRVIMVRVDQDLGHYLRNIPTWRLMELGQQYEDRTGNSPPPLPTGGDQTQIEQYLETVLDQPQKDEFKKAKGIYDLMGGEEAVQELNQISTGFTALSEKEIDGLHQHAFWQTLAGHAVYWDP